MFERIDGAPEYLIRKTINDRDHVDGVVSTYLLAGHPSGGEVAAGRRQRSR